LHIKGAWKGSPVGRKVNFGISGVVPAGCQDYKI
jgi:hypothetical protein